MNIAIIPARGGSKGVPRKNIKDFCGKPLVAWSIEDALNSKLIDEVYVSTEDDEIAEIAKSYGAKISVRPAELANDTVKIKEIYFDFVNRYKFDNLIVLQPTSPIRVNNLIDRVIERFLESGADSIATGFTSVQYEWTTNDGSPRQELKGWFYDDGNVYVHKPEHLKRCQNWGEKKEKMIIEEYYNYEIDTEYDWVILESLMRYVTNK